MKSILTIALVTLVTGTINAQQLSGGLRTGASHWMDKQDGTCFTNSVDGQNTTWDKEVFLRANTKGKFAFEASLGHYAFDNSSRLATSDFFPHPGWYPQDYQPISLRERSQNVEMNLSLQYDMTCAGMQSCPILSKLKSYVGVVVTPTVSYTKTEITSRRNGDAMMYTSTATESSLAVWTGLSYTLIYNLCEHMYLTSAVRYQIEPNKIFSDSPGAGSNPDNRLGLQVGLGYNLK
jgi:hypothetical protein